MMGFRRPGVHIKKPSIHVKGVGGHAVRAGMGKMRPHLPVTKGMSTHPRVKDAKRPRAPKLNLTMSVHDILKKHL